MILLSTNLYKKNSIYSGKEDKIIGIVYKKKKKNDKVTLYLKGKEKIIVNYYNEE